MAVLETLAEWVLWGAFVLLLYVYAGYPLLAWLRARLRPRPILRQAIEPRVTVIVVAHNEGHRIGRRIENLLASDYPRERLTIVVASDGSTDDTVRRASRYVDAGVFVRAFRKRRGKPAVLNELVPAADGEIVVLADARQRFESGAIRRLVACLADPEVGAVSGELLLRKRKGTTPAGEGAGFYWKYEKRIRICESAAGSTVGVTGAIYAIRRQLYVPIPPDTLLDDVLIPMQIVRQGYRVVLETSARAHDLLASSPREDFTRKTRTIAGTFQLFARNPWMLHPRRCRVWLEALSHKALRLTIPVLHASMLAANLALLARPVYRFILVGQLAFYAAAVLGKVQLRYADRSLLVAVPYTMCLLGWATIVGCARIVARRQRVTWEKAVDTASPPATAHPR